MPLPDGSIRHQGVMTPPSSRNCSMIRERLSTKATPPGPSVRRMRVRMSVSSARTPARISDVMMPAPVPAIASSSVAAVAVRVGSSPTAPPPVRSPPAVIVCASSVAMIDCVVVGPW